MTRSKSIWPRTPGTLVARPSISVFVTVLVSILLYAGGAAAVPVYINSGDPAFPFPQFLPYAHPNGDTLHNLGNRNPAGVVHAEMEKTIRDAYQIMMNRAVYHENYSLGTTRYIKFRSNPDCSEGTGYAMLAAAMMADKTTFDGLWLFTHDFAMNNVTRYRDGQPSSPGYAYSTLPGWTNAAGGNSAADGDFDIAIALLIAHMQWGDNMGINDSRGRPISYKEDVLKFLKGLTDTLTFKANNINLLSGDIGLDGYFKGGDSWGELSGWARSPQNLASIGINKPVEQPGGDKQHIDYTAPAYFRQFADYMKKDNAAAHAWNIFQFERAEASSDWLMGKLIAQDPRHIPVTGWVEMTNDTTPKFTSFSDGEDFRAAWRTILSYVWHGNPQDSWDPVKHVVIRNKSNTHEKDAGVRFSRFLWDRRQSPWNKQCETIIGEGTWWGPSMLKYYYSPTGDQLAVYPLNWMHGTGSPSAVTAQDTGLMAEMYRQCELEWDVAEPGDRYLTSTPQYFHGIFRLLGLMVLTGNHHAPLNMKRQANMKVYLDVDRTYAFENDTITYTIDYRNYGAADAQGVVITNRLHSDFVFISGTGGAAYDPASNTVKWNIGAVPGFKTATGVNPTKGTVSYKVMVPYANLKRYESKVEISCTNGPGWVSNEFPNKISSIMKRNGVDMARRALRVEHSVYRDTVNPGMTAIYTIDFENSAEAGWLNGGRPGVNFGYAHKGTTANSSAHEFMLRAFNDAHEAYVDYGNYRISYFLFDNNIKGTGANGWQAPVDIIYPREAEPNVRLLNEMITPGEDSKGKWNQRLIMQISGTQTDTNWATMAAPSQFLLNYNGLDQRVHRGTSWPFKAVWRLNDGYRGTHNWSTDWSFNPKATGDIANDKVVNWGYPVSPDFTGSYDPDYQGEPVKSLHRKLCAAPPSTVIDNVLIEEWDGYTWRRVFGNGPLPGREVNNVVIKDTLPVGVTFQNFIGQSPFGVAPKYDPGSRVVTWEIDKLLVGQAGKIQYSVKADPLVGTGNRRLVSRAWASADKESPTFELAILVVTLDSLPPPPPEPTTMYKTANKNTFGPGDTIIYKIAYKQTHGSLAKSTSAGQWAGSNVSISPDGGTINFAGSSVNMYFTPSHGINTTLTGTAHTVPYETPFSIFGRNDNSGKSVEVTFDHQWAGVNITVTSNGTEAGAFTVALPNEPSALDYKMIFRKDTLLIWVVDTAAVMPYAAIPGIATQAGYAGVRYATTSGYGSAKVTGWQTSSDLAYNVSIRDTIPSDVKFIAGSASGQLHTTPPKTLTASVSNNVIVWPVVSGTDPMGANDSLTVTWKGIVDSTKSRFIVNTAYADLDSHPRDAIGAQLRSGYSLSGTVVDPPDTTGPLTGLVVRATPQACIFTGSVKVTLSSLPGTTIYYTINRTPPDPERNALVTRKYDGPLEFTTETTLKAVAYADDYEQSPVVTHAYEPLKTVPVQTAFFYDNVGDGLAKGIKVVLPPNRTLEPNQAVISRHRELIELPGLPVTVDSLRFAGDTIVFVFRGKGVEPPSDARMIIREPQLPDARYTGEHGYLAEKSLSIIDGVAPVITEAIYYPSLDNAGVGVAGDTLAVTFNKYTTFANMQGVITPFVFTASAGAAYTLELKYIRHEGNTVYFEVVGISPLLAMPVQGDLVRINAADGGVLNIYSYAQDNPNNTAVPLKLKYPGLEYVLKAGPVPSGGELNIRVAVEPYLPAVFEALDPKVRIFDMLGNAVVSTGKGAGDLKVVNDGASYRIFWDGRNSRGRRVATGAYVVHVVVADQDGKKMVLKQKVYLSR